MTEKINFPTKDQRLGWLANLAVGDKVFVSGGGWGDNRTLGTVEKITPTGRMTVNGTVFDRTGHHRISSWSVTSLVEWSESREVEWAQAQRIRRELNTVMGINWRKVPSEVISQVFAILPKDEKHV